MKKKQLLIPHKKKTSISYLVLFFILLISGIALILNNISLEKRAATYEKTEFSFIVINPSNSQINAFKQEPSIDGVLSVYNMNVSVIGSRTDSINLLLSDDENSQIGFFNDSTVLKGKVTSGLLLDETAAKKLKVVVGDSVTVYLNDVTFEVVVAQIHMPVNYTGLSQGLGYLQLTDAMNSTFDDDAIIDFSFIKTDSEDIVLNLVLKDYIPEGRLMSLEYFISEYKANNPKPANLTESEWEAEITESYNNYYASFYDSEYLGDLHIKALKGSEIINQVKESRDSQLIIAIVIIILSMIFIVFYNTLIFIGHKDEYKKIINKSQKTMVYNQINRHYMKNHLVIFILVLVSLLVFSFLTRFTLNNIIFSLAFSLPILVFYLYFYLFFRNLFIKKKDYFDLKRNG